MNVERLHAIALALREDLRGSGLLSAMRLLSTALQNLANQPNQTEYQQAVTAGLNEVHAALQSSEVDGWPASWQETLVELGLWERLGSNLQEIVDGIMLANEITPQTAAEQIQSWTAALEADSELIDQLINSFERLNLGAEELDPGEAEVMVSIPRGAVRENLPDLGQEFRRLNTILGPFVEIVTGSREPLRVRAIASSDYGLYLQTVVHVGAFIAVAVERLIAAYRNIQDIQMNREEMAAKGVPAEALEAIDEHTRGRMLADIQTYIDEVIDDRLGGQRDGRPHELALDLRNSLYELANRIDAGYNFDVRAGEEEPDDTGDVPESPDPEVAAAVVTIKNASPALKYVNRDGGGFLHLPVAPSSAEPHGDDETPPA